MGFPSILFCPRMVSGNLVPACGVTCSHGQVQGCAYGSGFRAFALGRKCGVPAQACQRLRPSALGSIPS